MLRGSLFVGMDLPVVRNRRDHWTDVARRTKKQKEAVGWHLLAHMNQYREHVEFPCTVKMTRVGSRRVDDDNLRDTLKAVRDAIAKWLGVDDGSDKVRWEYDQRTGAPHGVEIEFA